MQSKATTVDAYVKSLPEDRRDAIQAIRKAINANLGKGFQETMQYGMIGYNVPHSIYPNGYHCDPKQPLPFAALASQKNHLSVYIMSLYMGSNEEKWFKQAWAKTGKKLDMGKCCVRFTKIENAALDVIGEAFKRISVEDYIKTYEGNLKGSAKAKAKPASKPVLKKAAKKTAKKPTKKPTKKAAKKK